ncbi:glutathione S-transferase family protein [Shimia thalassica]|uniref:glutathione S-transferase family protein n=1 Tax=Shimia thalassica TaxID=1715693 RepID=UPI0026E1C1D6|nr:glutathione S-transferase family protein [Shimia thalassica]MDO6798464.1 glutathione S-transferase family protein [Shimia thalassica]
MIRLHHIPFSRSFRVLWLLEELGLKTELSHYSITDGSLRASEFKAISPVGRVPALEIDGITIYESAGIVEYLTETRPEHGLGRLAGDPERVPFLEWLGFAETQASILASLNMHHLFMGDPTPASPVTLKLEAARLAATLKALEAKLDGQEWLLASGFSAADTMMGFNLFAAPYYVHLDRFENVCAYIERIKERPAYQEARKLDGKQEFYKKDFYEVPNG